MNYREICAYLFKEETQEERRIAELEEAVADLQEKTFRILETLSSEDRTVIEGCIYGMEELNLHMVAFAYNKGLEKEKENARRQHPLCRW